MARRTGVVLPEFMRDLDGVRLRITVPVSGGTGIKRLNDGGGGGTRRIERWHFFVGLARH